MNRTERVFYTYASAAPYEAEILELRPCGDGNTQVFLDKTIFYPDGGGQPSDRGTINGVSILEAREKEGEIFHLVSGGDAAKLRPGPAELILDSRRRLNHTQLHTGQHLLSATILRMAGAPTVSMHMGDEYCTIDVDIAKMSDEILLAVEEAVASSIEENHPIIVHLCPPEDVSSFPLRKVPPQGEDVIRIVEIEDCDFIACCGTHLKSTAEIGLLSILGAEKYKGMTRISFLTGRRLLLDSRHVRQNAVIISRALSIPVNEIGKGVLEFLEKSAQAEKKLKSLEEKAIQEKAEVLISKAASLGIACDGEKDTGQNPQERETRPPIVVHSFTEESIDEVLSIGKALKKETQALFILASFKDLKFIATCSAKDYDLRPLIKEAFEANGGRGGGSSSFFQGSFGTKEALEAFLKTTNSTR